MVDVVLGSRGKGVTAPDIVGLGVPKVFGFVSRGHFV